MLIPIAGDVDVIGIGYEAGDRARRKKNDSAAMQFDIFERVFLLRIDAYEIALFQGPLEHAYNPPGTMVMDGRPLTGKPNQCEQAERIVIVNIDGISCIVLGVAAKMLWFEKTLVAV